MFTQQTEAALVANLGAEGGQPLPVTLTAEVYRELVYAARQWKALTAGAMVWTGCNPPPVRLTPVGAGDGNTFIVG